MRGRKPFKINIIRKRRLDTSSSKMDNTYSQHSSYSRHSSSPLPSSPSPERRYSHHSLAESSGDSRYSRYPSQRRNRSPDIQRSTKRDHPSNIRRSRSPTVRNSRECNNNRSSSIWSSRSRRNDNSRSPRNDDAIEALSRAVNLLTEEVRSIKATSQSKPYEPSQHNRRRTSSSSPEPEAGYRQGRYNRYARNILENMDKEQYKNFHDEVVQILNGLDDTLQLDHTKAWSDISHHIAKNTMKAIDKAMMDRFQYKEVELKFVLQQLHRHRRESWQISLNPEKAKSDKKRKGINSRRCDKKLRRQKGLSHMFNVKDSSLSELKPPTLSWDEFKKDCEFLIDEGGFHSDEISETDDDLAKEEIDTRIRPKNKDTDKHVLHVYNKKWRSRRARDLLRLSDQVGEKTSRVKTSRRRWYEDNKWYDNSKPPKAAPKWSISKSYGDNK